VVLTTHYIEEAERLCDRIAVIDGGRIIATGTPAEMLAHSAGRSHITIRLEQPLPLDASIDVPLVISSDRLCLHAASSEPTQTLVLLVRWIDSLGIAADDIQMKRPTLEDVYIELTGKRLRE
jgi:ABC-2 type transport system ATP-binding protein